MKSFFSLIAILFVASLSYGQDLVYRPKNPAFGGDTFNYQWMLSSADAQNEFQDPQQGREEQSDIDRFADNLNNQLLNQISRELFGTQFGTEGLQEGTFSFGNLFVEIFQSTEGLVVNILDTTTGDQTQIIVPQ